MTSADSAPGSFIEVESGVRLFVQDLGSGPPVVLLAGFGLSHPVWDGEVRELVEAGQRVICMDLRGTGRSDKPLAGYELERLSADVGAVIEALDLDPVLIVGWSFGGQIAFHRVASDPGRFRGLALVCSNAVRASRSDEFPFGAPAEALESVLVGGERRDRLGTRRRTIAFGFAAEPAAGVVDFLVSVQLQMPSWAAIACYASYLYTDLISRIPEIGVPVLQVLGEEDKVTPPAGAQWLADRLGDSRTVSLPGCGHYPMFEAGEAFRDALVAFVAGR